jgi:ribosome modulation factor
MGYEWTRVLNEGAEAGLDGLPVDHCPYPAGSPEFVMWVSGWRCASEGREVATNGPEAAELAAEQQTGPADESSAIARTGADISGPERGGEARSGHHVSPR